MKDRHDSNEFYEWFAEYYPQVYGWRPDSLVERWGRLSGMLRDAGCGTVLDAACGVGRDALELVRLGFNVVGVDLSPDMIAVARRQAEAENLSIDFVHGDLSELSQILGVNRFDAVLCLGNSLLHAADRGQTKAWITELAACLKPGGLLFLQVETVDHLPCVDAPAEWQTLKVLPKETTTEVFLRRVWHRWDVDRIEKNFLHLRLQDGACTVDEHTTSLQMLGKTDIDDALVSVDMKTVSLYAGLRMDPYVAGQSDGLFVIARKAR